jgi:hypothetical protein
MYSRLQQLAAGAANLKSDRRALIRIFWPKLHRKRSG